MTWKIKVEYIDDKTGEYFSNQKAVTDDAVKNSNLDALDIAFQELTYGMVLKIKETSK